MFLIAHGHTEERYSYLCPTTCRSRKNFPHLSPKNWLLLMTIYVVIFHRFDDGQFNHWRCLSRRPLVSINYHCTKAIGTRNHEDTNVPKPVFLLTKIPYRSQRIQSLCSRHHYRHSYIYRAVVFSSSNSEVVPRFRKFIGISPGLSQNRSFYLRLTDKWVEPH